MNKGLSLDNDIPSEVNLCPKCGNQRKYVRNGTYKGKEVWAWRCGKCSHKALAPWRERNAEKIKTYRKERYQKDPEKYKLQRREAYRSDPLKWRMADIRYNKANPEKRRALRRNWYKTEKGREYSRMASRKYKMRKRVNSPEPRVTWPELTNLKKTELHCRYCGIHGSKTKMNKLVIDHMMPLKLGGGDIISNLTMACDPCNKRKAGKHPEVWAKEKGLNYPFTPTKNPNPSTESGPLNDSDGAVTPLSPSRLQS